MARRARFKAFPRPRQPFPPSMKAALGITRAKRRVKRTSGYYAATRWTRAPHNAKRRMLRRAGYYSGPMQFLRLLMRVLR